MKKDKKTHLSNLWAKWTQSPDFFKNFLVFAGLLILVSIAFVIIGKRYLEKKNTPPEVVVLQKPPQLVVPQDAPQPMPPSPVPLQALSDRVTALENRLNQETQTFQTPQKLVAYELLRTVLEGQMSLDALKTFLQRHPDPWAQTLVVSLSSVKENKTYSQLETLLVLPPSHPPSLWGRIKRKIKSLIHIRKLDEKREEPLGQLEDVQKWLLQHDIQKALEAFEKLPAQEKAQLSSWKSMAEDRLTLEKLMHNLLSQLGSI